ALVAVDPLDPLDSLQAALAVRAGAAPLAAGTSSAGDRGAGGRSVHGLTASEELDAGGIDRLDGAAGPTSALAYVHRIPPRSARTAGLDRPLPEEIATRIGVDSL